MPPLHAVPTPDPDRTSTTPTGWGDRVSNDYGDVCAPKVGDFTRKVQLEVFRTIVRDALKAWVA